MSLVKKSKRYFVCVLCVVLLYGFLVAHNTTIVNTNSASVFGYSTCQIQQLHQVGHMQTLDINDVQNENEQETMRQFKWGTVAIVVVALVMALFFMTLFVLMIFKLLKRRL